MLDMDLEEFAAARSKLDQARAIVLQREDNVAIARVGLVEGKLYQRQGLLSLALAKASEVWDRVRKTENPRLKGRAATLCGSCAEQGGNIEGAKRQRDLALKFFEKDGSRDYAWEELIELNGALTPGESIERVARYLLEQALLGQMPLEIINDRFEEQVVSRVYQEKGSTRATIATLQAGENKIPRILKRLGIKAADSV